MRDAAALLIVETADNRVIMPVIYIVSLDFRERLFGFERIINDDEIGASPG